MYEKYLSEIEDDKSSPTEGDSSEQYDMETENGSCYSLNNKLSKLTI